MLLGRYQDLALVKMLLYYGALIAFTLYFCERYNRCSGHGVLKSGGFLLFVRSLAATS